MMSVQRRLNMVAGMIRMRAYDSADKKANLLYEDYVSDIVDMSDEQYDYLIVLLDEISRYFYG